MCKLVRSTLAAVLLLGAASAAHASGGWPRVVAPGAYFGFSFGTPWVHHHAYGPYWYGAPRFSPHRHHYRGHQRHDWRPRRHWQPRRHYRHHRHGHGRPDRRSGRRHWR